MTLTYTPTGIPALDETLGGGYPSGILTIATCPQDMKMPRPLESLSNSDTAPLFIEVKSATPRTTERLAIALSSVAADTRVAVILCVPPMRADDLLNISQAGAIVQAWTGPDNKYHSVLRNIRHTVGRKAVSA